MSSLWTDLLFLHGHLTDWRLARRLSSTPAPPASLPSDNESQNQPSTLVRRSMLTLRLCLGIGSGELHKQ
jgi:hypothetical protein